MRGRLAAIAHSRFRHFRDMRGLRIQVSLRGKSGHSAGVAEGPGLTLSRPQGSQLTKAGSIKQFGKVRNMKRDARAFFIRFLLALLRTRRCSLCLGLSPGGSKRLRLSAYISPLFGA